MADLYHFRSDNNAPPLRAKSAGGSENVNNGGTLINAAILPNVPAMLKGDPYCLITDN
jgi:hypothetical protein